MEIKTSIAIQKAGGKDFKWIDLPASEEEIRGTLKELEIDENEQFLTVDYESDLKLNAGDWKVDNLKELLELNKLYKEFDELEECEQHEVGAILEYEQGYLRDALKMQKKMEFVFYRYVSDEYDLGKEYADEDLPYYLRDYFDYEEYGKDCAQDEGGMFTAYGYIRWA